MSRTGTLKPRQASDTLAMLSPRGLKVVTQAMRDERKMWTGPPRAYLDALYICLLLRLSGKLEVLDGTKTQATPDYEI